jgi:hypothetical protein
MDLKLMEMIEQNGILSKGKQSLLNHLNGEKLTRKEAMDAQCYSCMCYFVDGRQDCKMKNCPLFPYRPYKDKTRPQKSKKK